MEILEFTSRWIPDAMELAEENYQEEKAAVPALPEMPHFPSLEALAENGLGVIATQEGRLLGYLGAYGPWEPVFCTPNVRGVFSPIHAHGAVLQQRDRIYQRLYQAAAEKWVRAGAVSHAVTFYAHDRMAQEAMFYYGFGMRCMDLIRNIAASGMVPTSNSEFCELPVERHGELLPLRTGLSDHLAQSPCFMTSAPGFLERWLEKREKQPPRVFAALVDGEIVAYLEVQKEGENFISSGKAAANICGAFCKPELRGQNRMAGLLRYAMAILEQEGYSRLGVDCESFNPTALRFWSKHFSAYTHSLVRRIDENSVIY